MTFADNLRTLRLQRGLSQVELAELVGIDQSTIAGYKSGECKPKFDVTHD